MKNKWYRFIKLKLRGGHREISWIVIRDSILVIQDKCEKWIVIDAKQRDRFSFTNEMRLMGWLVPFLLCFDFWHEKGSHCVKVFIIWRSNDQCTMPSGECLFWCYRKDCTTIAKEIKIISMTRKLPYILLKPVWCLPLLGCKYVCFYYMDYKSVR